MTQSRQLAAIMFTDIVGYTALMEQDEKRAFEVLKKNLHLHQTVITAFHGRLIKELGDGILATFSTVSDALNAAIRVQEQCNKTGEFKLSVGIHQGEVVFENGDVFGDAVNVSSRIQSLGTAGSILFSKKIADEIKNKIEFHTVPLGSFEFKNVNEPIEVFALANDGFTVPRRNRMQGKLKHKPRKQWLTFGLLAILIISLALIGNYWLTNLQHEKDLERSIAVLPFDDLSEDGDQEWFSDGLSEEILNRLAQLPDLQVTARTSSFFFKGKSATIPEIASKLGVVYVVEGSVRRIENQFRITAQLIRAKDGFHLWSQNYDRPAKDIFNIQDEIAEGIARALVSKITAVNKPQGKTSSDEAYRLYLKGRFFWDKRTAQSYDSAESYYSRALEIDPEYALAYTGLADCYTFTNNRKGLTRKELVPIAQAYVQKALAIDSNLAEALTTKAFIQSHFEFDWKGAILILQKAISLNPNYPSAHLYYGNILFANGNVKQGIAETKKALELDPLSSSVNWVLGRNYFYAKSYDLAIPQLQKTLAIGNYLYAQYYLGLCLMQKKEFSQAIDTFNNVISATLTSQQFIGDEPQLMIINCHAMSGDIVRAKLELQEFLKQKMNPNPYWLSALYVSLGESDQAMTQLEKGYELRVIHIMHLKVNPLFDPIRKDPRFVALMKKMNFN